MHAGRGVVGGILLAESRKSRANCVLISLTHTHTCRVTSGCFSYFLFEGLNEVQLTQWFVF